MQREQFEKLVTDAREKLSAVQSYRLKMDRRYGGAGTHHWASKELRKYHRLRNASDKANERVFKALDKISPRSWRTIVPYYWAIENVTFEMAVSADEIPTPPASYGYEPTAATQWASAVCQ